MYDFLLSGQYIPILLEYTYAHVAALRLYELTREIENEIDTM